MFRKDSRSLLFQIGHFPLSLSEMPSVLPKGIKMRIDTIICDVCLKQIDFKLEEIIGFHIIPKKQSMIHPPVGYDICSNCFEKFNKRDHLFRNYKVTALVVDQPELPKYFRKSELLKPNKHPQD